MLENRIQKLYWKEFGVRVHEHVRLVVEVPEKVIKGRN